MKLSRRTAGRLALAAVWAVLLTAAICLLVRIVSGYQDGPVHEVPEGTFPLPLELSGELTADLPYELERPVWMSDEDGSAYSQRIYG